MPLTRLFLCGREWRFSRADGTVIAEKIRFKRDGRIVGYVHPNEERWSLQSGILVFGREDDVATTRFGIKNLTPAPAVLQGKFLFDESITHVLTEVGRVPMPTFVDYREKMYASREELRMIPVEPNIGQPALVEPENLDRLQVTFAGVSQVTPRPQDLLNMLTAGAPEMELALVRSMASHPGIYGPLAPRPPLLRLRAKEVLNITGYSPADNHDPPRSSREHQYRAGYRWEAHVAFALDGADAARVREAGLPQMFDIEWRYRGTGGALLHSVYLSDLRGKTRFTFLHVTDTHVAARNDMIAEVLCESRSRHEGRRLRIRYQSFNDNLRATIRYANRSKIDFMVITGDLVDYFHDGFYDKESPGWYQDYIAGERGEYGGWLGKPAQADSNFVKFVEIISGRDGRGEMLNCPLFCVTGNHDYLRMEPPMVVNVDVRLGIIPIKQKLGMDPGSFNLTLDEAGEFEFWKRTQGDSLGERVRRRREGKAFEPVTLNGDQFILFGTPAFGEIEQYLRLIGYRPDFSAAIGPHRMILLNTGEDVGIPEAGNLSDPDSWDPSTAQKHYIDNQSHNRGILPSHLDLIREAVLEARGAEGLAFLFAHAPFARERKPGTDWPGDTLHFEGWGVPKLPDDTGSYFRSEMRARDSIPGLDGAIAEWKTGTGKMVEWMENGAGGVDVILTGHSHDVKEYRLGNGSQVSTGDYSRGLHGESDAARWLESHRPLHLISGRLKGKDSQFRQVSVSAGKLESISMTGTGRLEQLTTRVIRYLFAALSVDLARFGGYANPARNDIKPVVHLDWAAVSDHLLEVMWDLMEKYELQMGNISYLQELAAAQGTEGMSASDREKLARVDEALQAAIPVYRRLEGGLLPTPDYWVEKGGVQKAFWRLRVFYAVSTASLNVYGIDLGSAEKNSLDLIQHYRWCDYPRKNLDRLQDALEERIGKIFEFAQSGAIHMMAMWFASESVHVAPWGVWNENPARGVRDPKFHLAWALKQDRDILLMDLCEKYDIAGRQQYRSLQRKGLTDFYIYHSVRMAAWGASAGLLDEQPAPIFFEAEAARLRAIAADERAWIDLIIRDIQERVRRTGYPLKE